MKLELRNIYKSFGTKEVLHGISFSVESGKALGLLGRNGAGKTTTIRIIMDVFHADKGELLLDGKPFHATKSSIGYLPEERGLYPKKTVLEQMLYLARLRGMSRSDARTSSQRWLKRLGIEEYETKKLETLSKGNQQKVQLAATLVANPQIIILDEPFSGLDPVNAQILKEVVSELIEEGRIVIFSSHQMSYVEEFCEDIAVINKGEVVLCGSLPEIKREFGQNQLMINDEKLEPEKLSGQLTERLGDLLEVTLVQKAGCVVKCKENVCSKDILKRLLETELELERFENYKPSLNDIFVAKVGDEA